MGPELGPLLDPEKDPLLDQVQGQVLDLRMGNGNKLAAFNIETITGYHAVKLSSYNMLYMNQFDFLEDLDWLNESLFARIQNQKGGRMLMERFFDLFEIDLNKLISFFPKLRGKWALVCGSWSKDATLSP